MANYNLFDAASLAMVPTGIKDGKLYSVKPDDGSGDFTFSRGTNLAATRVNADGLIEKGRENLLLQSNQFDTTWNLGGGTLTSGQTGYDGSNDAWLFTYASGAAIVNQPNTQSGVQTYSVYAKGSAANGIRLYAFGSANANAYFDLNIGEVEVTGNIISASIEDKGNGWYRCSITFDQTNTNLYMYLTGNSNSSAGSGSILIQDAQLERGLVATDYIETTTAPVQAGITEDLPRIDYTDGCGSLLLEPSRTNLFSQSEYLINGSGWSAANLDRTANAIVSPEGVQNATEIEATGTGGHPVYEDIAIANGTYTISMFVKKGANTAKADLSDGYSSTSVSFDLDAGTINEDTPQTLNAFIEPYSDGWYRIGYTFAVTASQSQPALYLFDSSGNQNYTANGETMYIYGFQLEASSYPTSYIPTYGTATSRVADVCEKTSVSSLIGLTSNSVFIDVVYNGLSNNNDGATFPFLLESGSGGERFQLVFGADKVIAVTLRDNGADVAQVPTSINYLTIGTRYKIGFAYDSSGLSVYINGTLIGTDSVPSFPTLENIYVNDYRTSGLYKGALDVNQILLFKTRLTDNELAALTRPYDTYQEWVDGEGLTWESKSCTVQNLVELQNL